MPLDRGRVSGAGPIGAGDSDHGREVALRVRFLEDQGRRLAEVVDLGQRRVSQEGVLMGVGVGVWGASVGTRLCVSAEQEEGREGGR